MRNLVYFLFVFFYFPAFSQAICGFDQVHSKKLKTDPHYKKAVEENEKAIQKYIAKSKSLRMLGGSTLYTIPVVVHIMNTGGSIGSIYNPSDAQIQGAINYLNQVYNGTYPGTQGVGDLQIQFQLALKDPNCNSTSGIERIDASSLSGYSANGISTDPVNIPGVSELSIKNLSRWNPSQYYNIWIVNKIDGKDGTSGTFTAGYAFFPGVSPLSDGIVMLATQMLSGQKTLPHEIGHAFGLYHPFEGSADRNTCPVNDDCSIDGDGVCDTDPITFNQLGGVFDFSCRSGINSCTGTAYSINTESNYMNYTNCYTVFTAGQKARMLANAEGIYRRSLSVSSALKSNSSLVAYTFPVAAACTPVTSATGLSNNYAGIVDINLNNIELASSSTSYDNGYVDGTNSCLYIVQLIRGATYSFTVTVLGANHEQVRAWIDFNNDGSFDNSTEQIHVNSFIPNTTGYTSGNFTVPTTAALNTVLRMRVIEDLADGYPFADPISDACYNPYYGQAEDYPVYIVSGTLPVTLSGFRGQLKDKTAVLTWETRSEQNLKNFEVEKSADGINFMKIGTVNAAGESSTLQNYSFNDNHLSENNFYRLRMNDRDGQNKLSEVVLVRYNSARQNIWVVNNPIGNSITIGIAKPASDIRLQLINVMGAVVAEKITGSSAGTIKWEIPAYLSNGYYTLKAFADGDVYTSKLIRQ